MLRFARVLFFLSALLVAFCQLKAQTPQRYSRAGTGSISGWVTIGGKPAVNVPVWVMEQIPKSRDQSIRDHLNAISTKVRTDSSGRYRVTGLPEGVYIVNALSAAFVRKDKQRNENPFDPISLDEGESRDDVNFDLVRGGVITGRITDNDGKPLIAHGIQILELKEKGEPKEDGFSFDYGQMMETDDRGIYRIYGIRPGRYKLRASGGRRIGNSRAVSPGTFYPDATDVRQAEVIEVKEAEEITGIDIRLGAARRTYEAAGRVIDTDTGQPLQGAHIRCQEIKDQQNDWRDGYSRDGVSDGQGNFKISGLSPGRFELYLGNAWNENQEHYAERVNFEINDDDTSGLLVKALRGVTITGTVVMEGTNDPAMKTGLTQMIIFVQTIPGNQGDNSPIPAGFSKLKISADGGFRATGLSPGTAIFHVRGYEEPFFSVQRIERNGVQLDKLEVRAGEEVTGVRIVLIQANGVIRGQVNIAGGKLPEGWRLHVRVSRPRASNNNSGNNSGNFEITGYAVVDTKNKFVIGNLAPGEYELTLFAMVNNGQGETITAPGVAKVTQRITVTNNSDTSLTIEFDPLRKSQEGQQ